MGPPEVAVEVELEAGLGEVLSRWQLRRDWIIWPIPASYIPQEDGRVTVGLLPSAVVNRVKSLYESCRVFWETGRWKHIACYFW